MASDFLLSRQKKVTKENATLAGASSKLLRNPAEVPCAPHLQAGRRHAASCRGTPQSASLRIAPPSGSGARRGARETLKAGTLGFSNTVCSAEHRRCSGGKWHGRHLSHPGAGMRRDGDPAETRSAGDRVTAAKQEAPGAKSGSPFLWLLSFGDAKESSSPSGTEGETKTSKQRGQQSAKHSQPKPKIKKAANGCLFSTRPGGDRKLPL